MGKIGTTELLIVLAIVLVIFGPKALPKLGRSMGKTLGSFKKAHQCSYRKHGKKSDNAHAAGSKSAYSIHAEPLNRYSVRKFCSGRKDDIGSFSLFERHSYYSIRSRNRSLCPFKPAKVRSEFHFFEPGLSR